MLVMKNGQVAVGKIFPLCGDIRVPGNCRYFLVDAGVVQLRQDLQRSGDTMLSNRMPNFQSGERSQSPKHRHTQ